MALTAPRPTFCVANNKILDACQAHWETHKSDCSGFVRAVAAAVGVPLAGNADAIVDFIDGDNGWYAVASGTDAVLWAEAGYLVIGGLKGASQAQPSTHGHVVIVVPGKLAHGKYPSAWWGRYGGTGKKDTTINYSWAPGDRDKVLFRAKHPPNE